MTAYSSNQLVSGTHGYDFTADSRVGHDGEAAIHGQGAAQKANPAAQLVQHRIAQHGAKAKQEESDPQRQKNAKQKSSQVERADPQAKGEDAPQDQRQTDGAVGTGQIEQLVATKEN